MLQRYRNACYLMLSCIRHSLAIILLYESFEMAFVVTIISFIAIVRTARPASQQTVPVMA